MRFFGRRGPEGATEKEREPISVVKINFARHSFKGKTPEGREPIIEKGMVAAAEEGRKLGYYNDVVKKVERGGKIDLIGSPRERTSESGLFRLLGEQLKDVKFNNLDPLDLVNWIDEGGNLKRTETSLLDFGLGEGKYEEKLMEEYKAHKYMKWLVRDSDGLAISTGQDPEKTSTLSTQAGNVAGFIWAFGSKKSQELTETKEKSDFAFATSHGSILESFLYKAIKGKEGEKEADEFINSLNDGSGENQFSENQGFEVEFRTFSEADGDFDVVVNFNGKTYEVPSELIKQIIDEGTREKLAMEVNKSRKEVKKEEKK